MRRYISGCSDGGDVVDMNIRGDDDRMEVLAYIRRQRMYDSMVEDGLAAVVLVPTKDPFKIAYVKTMGEKRDIPIRSFGKVETVRGLNRQWRVGWFGAGMVFVSHVIENPDGTEKGYTAIINQFRMLLHQEGMALVFTDDGVMDYGTGEPANQMWFLVIEKILI